MRIIGRGMSAGKAIRCDCGHEVRAQDRDGLVEAIQRHAREEHGIDFPVDLARELAWTATQVAGGRENRMEEEER